MQLGASSLASSLVSTTSSKVCQNYTGRHIQQVLADAPFMGPSFARRHRLPRHRQRAERAVVVSTGIVTCMEVGSPLATTAVEYSTGVDTVDDGWAESITLGIAAGGAQGPISVLAEVAGSVGADGSTR